MRHNRLEKSYITTIDLTQEELDDVLFSVSIQFIHNNGGEWKGGWYFEGILLEPINNKTTTTNTV